MISSEITIVNKLGLHARAAAKLVATANAYASDVQLVKDGNGVNGKSIMAVMMLAASKGTVLTLEIDGKDEQAALEALTRLIDNRFDESE